MGIPWEVIYVDDHSQDGSLQVLRRLQAEDEHLRILRFRRNFGQTAAMAAGFDQARGGLVITLDADLQNDPADIPRLVAELEGGYDIVVGWRKQRQDGFVLRRLPSILANRMLSALTGVRIHDTGCTLKVFRGELVRNLRIYAEQHRFLPMLAKESGARIGELVVNHRARRFGTSKYGLGRTYRVLLDLMTITMIASFSRRPLQYFALMAAPFALGIALFVVVGLGDWERMARAGGWGAPALVVVAMLAMSSVFFLLLGLLAELAVKAGGARSRPLMGGGEEAA
jgi:glycosyltransferase involved in cell wall biosynthesis